MTRGQGILAAAIASVALLVALAPADERMKDTGGPGIVPFELTGGQERAEEILAEWGERGQDAARESLLIDFGFLVAYGALLTLLIASARDVARERGWARAAALGRLALPLGAVAAAFDALENGSLLLTLDGAGAAFPLLATAFASVKFLALALALAYLVAVLGLRFLSRPAAAGA